MVRQAQLSSREKKKIIDKVLEQGHSMNAVAKSMDRSPGTISYFIKKWKETGTMKRKSKMTSKDKKAIIKLVCKKPTITASKIKVKLGLDLSLPTITRYLNHRGFECTNTIKPVRKI